MLGFICGVLTGFFVATLALVLIRNKISSKMRRITGKKRAATIETGDWNENRVDVIGSNGNDGLHYK
jgi:hypothetical protein